MNLDVCGQHTTTQILINVAKHLQHVVWGPLRISARGGCPSFPPSLPKFGVETVSTITCKKSLEAVWNRYQKQLLICYYLTRQIPYNLHIYQSIYKLNTMRTSMFFFSGKVENTHSMCVRVWKKQYVVFSIFLAILPYYLAV